MTDERYLLAEVAAHPSERTIQFAIADWYADRNRSAEAEAWKWIATFRRHPVTFKLWRLDREPYWGCAPQRLQDGDLCAGWGWINWTLNLAWPWSGGYPTIPKELFRWLPKTNNPYHDGYNGHRPYDGVAEAFDALVKAFISATRPRTNRLDRLWNGKQLKPNWELATAAPQEE